MNPEQLAGASFFDQPAVKRGVIEVGGGVPFGLLPVLNSELGIGGVYGTWGERYANSDLQPWVEDRLGLPISESEKLDLAELGFLSRHHIRRLTADQNMQVELELGGRFLREAARACGWDPAEVDGVLIGMTAPISDDYVDEISRLAGIPDRALKVTVHKACDSSVSGLHLALNPALAENRSLRRNIAESLQGKKVLVGGIEGLSRLLLDAKDKNALQLFGNAAGVIGVIPGKTMKFLAGASRAVFDEDGVLQVHMFYPYSERADSAAPSVDVTQADETHIRIAGKMHEPADGSSIIMAGPMGMVKLFVRSGVQVVQEAYRAYQQKLEQLGATGKSLAVAIVHHANYKINKLKEKQLQGLGIKLPMPWLLSEFGNVSAASNMIAFLRELPLLKPGDHILMDGFGAGTYYDTLAVEVGA
jgi:3-oxoacyl-[acyl-carrier-protein] synthase III